MQSQPEEDLEGGKRALTSPFCFIFKTKVANWGSRGCMSCPLLRQKLAVTNTFLGKLEN